MHVKIRGKGVNKTRQIFYNKFRYRGFVGGSLVPNIDYEDSGQNFESTKDPSDNRGRPSESNRYKFIFSLFKNIIIKNSKYFKEKDKKLRRSKFTRKLEFLRPKIKRRVNSSLTLRLMTELNDFFSQQGEVWVKFTEYEDTLYKAR